jgi:broad specificity phosphatase PhoE
MPTIFFVRHGMTAEDMPGNELITGWREIPINAEGRLNAAHAARFLKSKGITSITSSDTKRALQTAKIISGQLDIPVVLSERLRSWNMGSLQGMDADAAEPFMTFFQKNPTVRVPEGEAFWAFYRRFKSAWTTMLAYVRKFPNARPLIVTHSQPMDIIPWFISGTEPGNTLEFGQGIKPGGVVEVNVLGDKISMRKLRF